MKQNFQNTYLFEILFFNNGCFCWIETLFQLFCFGGEQYKKGGKIQKSNGNISNSHAILLQRTQNMIFLIQYRCELHDFD